MQPIPTLPSVFISQIFLDTFYHDTVSACVPVTPCVPVSYLLMDVVKSTRGVCIMGSSAVVQNNDYLRQTRCGSLKRAVCYHFRTGSFQAVCMDVRFAWPLLGTSMYELIYTPMRIQMHTPKKVPKYPDCVCVINDSKQYNCRSGSSPTSEITLISISMQAI